MHRSPLHSRLRPVPILLLVFALAAAALFLSLNQPVSAAPPAQQDEPLSNAECLACHYNPDLPAMTFDGEQVSVTIDPAIFGGSVHGQENISCVQCHTDITDYPHPQRSGVDDRRDYSLLYRDACAACHEEQYSQTQAIDSIHYEAFLSGNVNAPICTDCHDPHAMQPLQVNRRGEFLAGERAKISQTCARCHSGVFEDYVSGVHGEALLNNNPDVPNCTDCHGVHEIVDPTTAGFRLSSVELCANCHTNPTIMNKYGLSTKVLDTFIDDFHGTTLVLFEQQHPDDIPNTPVCYDCHGFHNIVALDDPEEGLRARDNLLATCQRCHPEASVDFPTSWLGHYVPDAERYPLVYWVDVFYRIFIPTVIGGMVIFVATDVGRRIYDRRRGQAAKAGAETEAAAEPEPITDEGPTAESPDQPSEPEESKE